MIERETLSLPHADRERVAEVLVASLCLDAELSGAWDEEIQRRIRQADSGAATFVPVEDVPKVGDDLLRAEDPLEGLPVLVGCRYNTGMKTAISIPDELFTAADALATRLGVSRSELYSTAVAEFVAKHNPSEITERLNQVYATEDSTLDPVLRRIQAISIGPEEW